MNVTEGGERQSRCRSPPFGEMKGSGINDREKGMGDMLRRNEVSLVGELSNHERGTIPTQLHQWMSRGR